MARWRRWPSTAYNHRVCQSFQYGMSGIAIAGDFVARCCLTSAGALLAGFFKLFYWWPASRSSYKTLFAAELVYLSHVGT